MKSLIMMIGLPGSGKSTYCKDIFNVSGITNTFKLHIISLDRMIEKTMTANESYAEAFLRVQQTGELKQMYKQMYLDAKIYDSWAYSDDEEVVVIWDQTNLTAKSRKRKLDCFDQSWNKEARVFELSDLEWNTRLKKRQDETGKSIPRHVLMDMKKSYERPTVDEGFDYIVYMQ